MRKPMPKIGSFEEKLRKHYIDEENRDVSLNFVQDSLLNNP